MASISQSERPTRRPGRFSSRGLRRASFISPATGERLRRVFTLREASHRLDRERNETTPLLNGNMNGTATLRGGKPSMLDVCRAWCRESSHSAWEFANGSHGRGIFKCGLAYLLGSLVTLVPALAKAFGNNQPVSKHMVCTVSVWFHPARTIGSMHEAAVLAFVGFLYASFISFTSMGVSVFFGDHDLLVVGHVIVLLVFVGGGLGFVAWVKQRLGQPLVNVACSLASLGCIIILLREGDIQAGMFSVDRVVQILLMVLMGIFVVTAINWIVLPVSACSELTAALEKTTDLQGEMLISISRAFLSGRESDLSDEYYQELHAEHQDSLNTLSKNLQEAKREHLLLGRERQYNVEERLAECLSRLSQDLGGLRSAAFAQFAFMEGDIEHSGTTDGLQIFSPLVTTPIKERGHHFGTLQAIDEAPDESTPDSGGQKQQLHDDPANGVTTADESGSTAGSNSAGESRKARSVTRNDSTQTFHSAEVTSGLTSPWQSISSLDLDPKARLATSLLHKDPSNAGDMFFAFLNQLGPPTKSLVYSLKQILDELPFQKVESGKPQVAINPHFHASLRQAVDLYRQSRKDALRTLYSNRAALVAARASRPDDHISKTNYRGLRKWSLPLEELDSAVDLEEVAACCGYFSFALLDFAEDVQTYLEILEDLKSEMETPHRTWTWLKFWSNLSMFERTPRFRSGTFHESAEAEATEREIPEPVRKADYFADPGADSRQAAWRFKLDKALGFFRRDDVKFGIKVGIGAILYSLPAFIDSTRPIFVHWRGEWGLISYMAVCCMTIGASNTTGIHRFIGTGIGAGLAIISWIISNDHGKANPWLLGFFGWLVANGCFYLILVKDQGPMGRFILLTYNLGALYAYSLSIDDPDNEDDPHGIDPAIWDIVLHRFVAVIVGCIWGILITRFIWPISARRKLKDGLCILWLRMGLIWKRDPLAMLLLGEPRSSYMDIREEAELHSFLSYLDSLKSAAKSEFELRGPFPEQSTGNMLERTARMLDAFHAMNVVISKNLQYTPGEAAVLRYTSSERFELSARISHLFSVLASSVKLEYPLNDVLPSIEHTRDRLLARIAEFRRRVSDGKESAGEQDYELIYAYVLVTGQLSQDIQAVSGEIETLFGTLNEENLKLQ